MATEALARDEGVDAIVGGALVEVKRGVSGMRSVRVGLMQLAHSLSKHPGAPGLLLLLDVSVTQDRLREEWERTTSILRPDLLERVTICIRVGDRFIGIPHEVPAVLQQALAAYLEAEHPHEVTRVSRGDAYFVVLKILLHRWLTNGEAVTTRWLEQKSGYSYPTVANVLAELGSLLERQSDRRVGLRWFPRDQFARLVAVSDRVRDTARFADRSATARTPEAHLRRLEKLRPPHFAVGGVLGAAHYFPEIDLVGVPRLDLSNHTPGGRLDADIIAKLDPALRPVTDPLEPASVVVHATRHADSLFEAGEGGMPWADPVECLLDLHEAHLDAQATQFLKALERNRPKAKS